MSQLPCRGSENSPGNLSINLERLSSEYCNTSLYFDDKSLQASTSQHRSSLGELLSSVAAFKYRLIRATHQSGAASTADPAPPQQKQAPPRPGENALHGSDALQDLRKEEDVEVFELPPEGGQLVLDELVVVASCHARELQMKGSAKLKLERGLITLAKRRTFLDN
jgi:hypothetical protein